MAKAEMKMDMECAFKHVVIPSREMIAAMVLQGMQANSKYAFNTATLGEDISYAIDYADALITELEQTKG